MSDPIGEWGFENIGISVLPIVSLWDSKVECKYGVYGEVFLR